MTISMVDNTYWIIRLVRTRSKADLMCPPFWCPSRHFASLPPGPVLQQSRVPVAAVIMPIHILKSTIGIICFQNRL